MVAVDTIALCRFFPLECGGFFYSPAGIFESPEWPKSYKGKLSCTWHITVDPSDKIALSFKSFSLDDDGTCGKAKLVVRDGSSENAKALGVYCGVTRPPEVTSSGNQLWVQFTSTEGAEGKGFLMSYDTGNAMTPQAYSVWSTLHLQYSKGDFAEFLVVSAT